MPNTPSKFNFGNFLKNSISKLSRKNQKKKPAKGSKPIEQLGNKKVKASMGSND